MKKRIPVGQAFKFHERIRAYWIFCGICLDTDNANPSGKGRASGARVKIMLELGQIQSGSGGAD